MARLVSDVDNTQSKRIFELIQTDTKVLDSFGPGDIDEVLNVLKVLQFKKGDCIAMKDEPLDIFGMVLFGELRIGKAQGLGKEQIKAGHKIHYLGIGDMFGFQNLAEQSGDFGQEKWKFDIFAESDGTMAVLPFGEIKMEIRR